MYCEHQAGNLPFKAPRAVQGAAGPGTSAPRAGEEPTFCPYLPGAQAQEQRGTDLLLGALG